MSDTGWKPFTGDFVDIEHWRGELDRLHDPSMVAFLLRSAPAVIAAGLDEMAWGLAREYGCRNDIIGLLDYLEKWQNEEQERMADEADRLHRIDRDARELQERLEAAGLRSRLTADQADAADRAWDKGVDSEH